MKPDFLPRVTHNIWTDLTKAASNFGGPTKFVEKIFISGRTTGRLEGVGITAGTVLIGALTFYGAKKIGDRIQKKKVAEFTKGMPEAIRDNEQNQMNSQDATGSESHKPEDEQ